MSERVLSDEHIDGLIRASDEGDQEARQQLFAALYQELHTIARRHLRRNAMYLTLGPTTLLHEAYLNLGERRGLSFPDRSRFLAYASRAMRGLIIDYARSRRALRRGAGFHITSLPTEVPQDLADAEQLQRLSDAMERLAASQPRLAQIVDLKYFSGFSVTDIAAICETSERTVYRDWEKARLFLYQVLSEDTQGAAPLPDLDG